MSWFQVGIGGWIYQNWPEHFQTFHRPSSRVAYMYKECFFMWFQVRATSCHLTSLKSAWKSTPKCTWMCWRVWWSPGAIRWPVADPGCGSRTQHWPTNPKRLRLGFRRSFTTLYPSLTGPPPPPPTWTCWSTSFAHTLRTSPTWPPTTPKPAWSLPSAEYSPSSHRRL